MGFFWGWALLRPPERADVLAERELPLLELPELLFFCVAAMAAPPGM